MSSHSLAFHTSKDITWLQDTDLRAVELWPVFLLHNTKHSSHRINDLVFSWADGADLCLATHPSMAEEDDLLICTF